MKKANLFILLAFSGKEKQKITAFSDQKRKKKRPSTANLLIRIGNAIFACEIAGCHASAFQMHRTTTMVAFNGVRGG